MPFLPPMTGNGKHTTKQKMVTGGWRPGGRGPENLLELFSNLCRSFPVWFFVLRISSFFRDSIWCYKILWSVWRFWRNPPLPSGKLNPINQPKVLLLIPLNPINHPLPGVTWSAGAGFPVRSSRLHLSLRQDVLWIAGESCQARQITRAGDVL